MLLASALALLVAASVQPDDTAAVRGTVARAPLRATRVRGAIQVDGHLREAAYATADSTAEFHQRLPIEGAAPTQRTAAWILYDDAALYVAARLEDTAPDSIIALLSRRDRFGLNTDRFFVYLDTYRDRRTGFFFGLSAAGTMYDGTLLNDDWDDDTWDGVWLGAVQRTPTGWSLEMRIPLSQLRFRPGTDQAWGVNFRRDIARRNEQDFVVFTPNNGAGFVSRFPELQGISELKPRARREVIPYATSRGARLAAAPGDPFRGAFRVEPDAGADLRLGLGSNLTLTGTVNPDFGQVEVDPAVVNLSDVEVFFQERRPFFIEQQNIFNFGVGGANDYWGFNWGGADMLYTRRIGRAPQGSTDAARFTDRPAGTRMLGAGKLSGRVGNWNVGALTAVTRREHARLQDGTRRWEQEVEPLTLYGVARAQKELNEGRQGLGLMLTAVQRDFSDPRLATQLNRSAYALGVDGWTFLDRDKVWVVSGWAGASRIDGTPEQLARVQRNAVHYFQRPDAGHVDVDPARTSLSGVAARVSLNKQRGNSFLNAAVGAISPGYDVNDLGLQFRADVLNGHVAGGYRWTQPGRLARFVRLNVAAYRSWDFGGNVVANGLWHSGFFQWLNFNRMGWRFEVMPSALDNRLTRGGPLMRRPTALGFGGWWESDDRKPVTYGLDWFGNYAPDDWNRAWGGGTYVDWRPTASMNLRVGPSLFRNVSGRQYLTTVADSFATHTFGRRYVFGDLRQTEVAANIRLNWIFTPWLSFELFAQPLISSGRYAAVKELAAPRTFDFTTYGQDAGTIDRGTGTIDPDGPGPAPAFAIGQPDFTFASLRGNAVLRWEYIPGSTIFLVWNHNRSRFDSDGSFSIGRSLDRILAAPADNIVAVKVTYWWAP